jgi:nitrite reductase/ring-hydroxylating ferredoxin subunit
MGRSILLTRSADNTVRAFDNVCLHRQSRIVEGCGAARRIACPYHAWTYDLDGNLVGVPGNEGFPEIRSGPAKLTELPATECAGFLWISLDRNATQDIPAFLGPLADELESWGIGRWAPLGEKVLDCPINWKLAIDTFAENYHFATVHKATFATIATCVSPQRNSRPREHSGGAVGPAAEHGGHLRAVPEHRGVGDNRQRRTVPRLSRRRARPLDHGASELDSAGSFRRVDGRNEPGLQHRHQKWSEAI